MYFKLLKNKQKTKENLVLKNKKTQEKSRGRSMVEMLGVLAIIGVLSIGGISGYTIAMRRYRANEIIDIAGKYALMSYTQIDTQWRNDPDLIEIDIDEEPGYWLTPNNNGGYTRTAITSLAIPFSDSGLGGLPNGIFIKLKDIKSIENKGDYAIVLIGGLDDNLCHTIATIADLVSDMKCKYIRNSSILIQFNMN